MTLTEFFAAVAQLSGLLFIVASMLAMWMSLTIALIIQPLKNARLVLLAPLANFVLVPLAIGLLIKAHSPEEAAHWQPVMNKISSLAILVLLVVGLGLNVSNILDLIGSFGLLALLLFIGC